MKIAAVKLLQRLPNGAIKEIISVPKFEIPEDFIQSLLNLHLSESNGKPNFKKIEGESLILSFFSGNKDVFMVEPYFDLIIIPQDQGDEKEYLRVSRILLNNFLVHVQDPTFEEYVENVINKINSEGTSGLKIEKKEIKQASTPQEPTIVPQTTKESQESNKFSDINELVQEIKPESAVDPFSGASGAVDPFGGASGAVDPFGGASGAVDSFGNGSDASIPLENSGTGQKAEPIIRFEFKSIDPKEIFKSGDEDIAFSENPWAQEESTKKDKKENKEPDPFSENPFG